jgi:hypothetical protein
VARLKCGNERLPRKCVQHGTRAAAHLDPTSFAPDQLVIVRCTQSFNGRVASPVASR